MNTSITGSIKDSKRLEQYAIFKELKRSPGCIRRVHLLQNLLKPVAYMFLIFATLPLAEKIGTIGYSLLCASLCMLFDELLWRFLVIPALDKELRFQANQGAAGNHR